MYGPMVELSVVVPRESYLLPCSFGFVPREEDFVASALSN